MKSESISSSLAGVKPRVAHRTQDFQPEDYARFLIREFLKKNGFERTYDQFIREDTREKATMTKNQLASLLGIDELMKRNFKLRRHQTMLDVLCDYLIAFKENVDPKGVAYPIVGPSAEAAETRKQQEFALKAVASPQIRP
jgi:hypothetical protein